MSTTVDKHVQYMRRTQCRRIADAYPKFRLERLILTRSPIERLGASTGLKEWAPVVEARWLMAVRGHYTYLLMQTGD